METFRQKHPKNNKNGQFINKPRQPAAPLVLRNPEQIWTCYTPSDQVGHDHAGEPVSGMVRVLDTTRLNCGCTRYTCERPDADPYFGTMEVTVGTCGHADQTSIHPPDAQQADHRGDADTDVGVVVDGLDRRQIREMLYAVLNDDSLMYAIRHNMTQPKFVLKVLRLAQNPQVISMFPVECRLVEAHKKWRRPENAASQLDPLR